MKRKRIIGLLMILLVVGLTYGCGNTSKHGDNNTDFINENEHFNFTGTISEMIDTDSAIVKAVLIENNPEGKILVDLSVNEDEVFEVGDQVKVEFDGPIMESDPMKIHTLSVELIEE